MSGSLAAYNAAGDRSQPPPPSFPLPSAARTSAGPTAKASAGPTASTRRDSQVDATGGREATPSAGAADLVVSSGSLTFSPPDERGRREGALDVRVDNEGSAAADGFVLTIRVR